MAGLEKNQLDQTGLSPPQLPEGWPAILSWCPSPIQQACIERLYQLILQGNQRLNLTRITAPEAFLEKHLWDSFQGIAGVWQDQSAFPLPALETGATVIDIGTGAGFPGVPVAIACPQWQVTLLDSTRKKIAFLNTLLADLNLTNVQTLNHRAETLGTPHQEMFDLALIRAVGPAATCAAYALPLLKPGGTTVLYRGHWSRGDTQTFQANLASLGGSLVAVECVQTPVSQSTHNYLYVQKQAENAS